MSSYPHLLSPGRIGSLELRNRIVLTPMGTNLEAEDGTPGERIARFYEERARGGVGLVIAGVTGVAWPAGVSNPHNMGLSREDFVAPFAALARRVQAHGAKLAVQLQHAGRTALQDVLAGRPLWVPSALPDSAGDLFDALTPEEIGRVTQPYRAPGARLSQHEMTREDVATVCDWFAAAAERARRAGIDGVEIHAGHGYLIASFLSPSTNRRSDEYGGPLENRARLLVEVVRAVRARVGSGFPLWCRLDGIEYRKQTGISAEDARRTAELAVAAGLDAVHVSAYADPRSAIGFTDAPLPHAPGAYVELAAGIKARVGVPVIAVGRIEPERGEALLREGRADFVAMGRKLIADPELPNKLARGEPPRPCVYAYRCVGNVFLRQHSTCVVNPRVGRELEEEPRAISPRRVLVAGGGPAGLEAARRLAVAGHRVTLCERGARLGGLGRAAAAVEPANAPLLAWLEDALARAGVEVQLGEEVTPERAEALAPDAVVVATGARAVRPDVPGADASHVFELASLGAAGGLDALLARGPRVTVLGGGLAAAEIAEALCARDARVTLVVPEPHLAVEMAPPRRWRAVHALAAHGAERQHVARLLAIEPDAVQIEDAEGAPQRIPSDAVVLAAALVSDLGLVERLAGRGLRALAVGDCQGPGSFERAFLDARRATRDLAR